MVKLSVRKTNAVVIVSGEQASRTSRASIQKPLRQLQVPQQMTHGHERTYSIWSVEGRKDVLLTSV